MSAIVAGIVGAGLNLLGAASRNAAIKAQANENWNATLTNLGVQRAVNENNLLFQGDEINRESAFNLLSLEQQRITAEADQVADVTERSAYGNTAGRLTNQANMDAALMVDNIQQGADAAMMEVQSGLSNTMYQYNNGTYGASMQRANSMNQMQGGLEMITGAVSSGLSFASGYKSMMGQ
mgnify:CR=1 FL=1